jgi:NitT/TauT family transport system ATP-binding protein
MSGKQRSLTVQPVTAGRIEVHGVMKTYALPQADRHVALLDVSLSVRPGAFTCIVGASGCGKSTLLFLLGGLLKPDRGTVDITGLHPPAVLDARSPKVGMVFQDPRLLPWKTVRANVSFALHDWPHDAAQERVTEVLEHVGLGHVGDRFPNQLSGGMQQRVAIARALAVNPGVLLMDEPFSALDEMTARRLRMELLSLWDEFQTTVVFVTHNALEASYLADRILVMKARTIETEIEVRLTRPRVYEDPALFSVYRTVVNALGEIERVEADGAKKKTQPGV